MLSVAHTLISLPFGIYLENPWLIFATAFIFHLFTDTLLHWNIFPDHFKRYPLELVALDVLGGLVLAWLVAPNLFWTLPIWAAIAGGNAPDVISGLWELLPRAYRRHAPRWTLAWFDFHDGLQQETTKIAPGLLWQITLSVVAVILLKANS